MKMFFHLGLPMGAPGVISVVVLGLIESGMRYETTVNLTEGQILMAIIFIYRKLPRMSWGSPW